MKLLSRVCTYIFLSKNFTYSDVCDLYVYNAH